MKKLLIALVVVAIASVAQAELLATWTFADGASTVAKNALAANIDKVTFGELTRVNLGTASTKANQFASNNWGWKETASAWALRSAPVMKSPAPRLALVV